MTDQPRFGRHPGAGERGDSAPGPSSGAAAEGPTPRPFLTEEDVEARRRPVGVQDIVDGLMNRIGGGRAGPGARLSAAWEDIVGSEYVARTRPGSCDSGRLVVLVADGATASKLRFMTTQILQRATNVVGDGVIDRISFRVTPGLGR